MLKTTTSNNEIEPTFVHVHVCIHCGHARRREEITGRELGSGILRCPNCASESSLNVEIREALEFAATQDGGDAEPLRTQE